MTTFVRRGMLAVYVNGLAREVFIYMATAELRTPRGDRGDEMPNVR
jgi:hypothetical protein